jgi:steroid delta-isomerase-like uncharacterized protein
MPVAHLEARAREFFDRVINPKNLEYLDLLLAENFVDHEDLGPVKPDRNGVKQFLGMLISAFPDLNVTVEDIISDGDKVAIRSTWRGTQQGEFMGIPPTGKAVSYAGIDIMKFSGEAVSEHWGLSDNMTMMTQLGLLSGQ